MNQSPNRFTRTSRIREARQWLVNLIQPTVAMVPGSLCRVQEDALKLFRKSSLLLRVRIGGTATTSALSETPLRLSPSKCEEAEMRREEGLQWVLIPIRQTVPAHSDQADKVDPDERPPMPFPKDFEWPTPEYIKCSDLAKCGYPHIYTILERGLEALGWTYNINVGRWYPPPTVPGDQLPKDEADGKDNLERETSTSQGGVRPPRKGQGTRRQGSGLLPY